MHSAVLCGITEIAEMRAALSAMATEQGAALAVTCHVPLHAQLHALIPRDASDCDLCAHRAIIN
jgi:hypothetical protein